MRTERGGERAVYHALAALLFAALCAWSAAALYRGLEGPGAAALSPEPSALPAPASGRLRGLLLRREERVPAGAFPEAEEGARLEAARTGTESALYFTGCDGWEFLTPEAAQALSPGGLEALLDAPAPRGDPEGARLVYGFTLGVIALWEGDAPPAPGPVRLRLEGIGELDARLLSVTEDALGRRLLLLRLSEFPETLYRARLVEGEIF